MKAIGYVRVSTEGQDEKYGKEVQKEAIRKYAQENGHEIVCWLEDIGSGAKEREGFNKIIYSAENPPFECVIVFKNDRVARDTKLYFYYLYVLERKNIKLFSVQESFETESEFANVYRALLQFVAEQERQNIMIRTSRGRSAKALKGGYAGGRIPYGYKVIEGDLTIVDEEAEVVRLIFKWHKELGYTSIAERLNGLGYRKRDGKEFALGTVKCILNNEKTYQGYYKYGNGEWVKGQHEAII